MDPSGILTTSAEISIAIAGFSGIVLAIGPRNSGEWPQSSRSVLSTLLVSTAATFVFCFVPLLVASAQLQERAIWLASSFLHFSYLTGIASFRFYQSRRTSSGDHPVSTFYMFVLITLCVMVLQLINAVLLRAAWPYFVAIVAMNLASFIAFAVLLWTFVRISRQLVTRTVFEPAISALQFQDPTYNPDSHRVVLEPPRILALVPLSHPRFSHQPALQQPRLDVRQQRNALGDARQRDRA